MAFDMRVIGIRRDPRAGAGHADAVHAMSELKAVLPQVDFVALTCPLTAETENLIDADALRRIKPPAYVLNAARGRDGRPSRCRLDVLALRQIRGPRSTSRSRSRCPRPRRCGHGERADHAAYGSPLEDDVLPIMQKNLARPGRGETELLNQVV